MQDIQVDRLHRTSRENYTTRPRYTAAVTHIVSFRPGVAANRTAFEAMRLIYEHLREAHGYEFTIVTSTTDTYEDPVFEMVSIPPKAWKPFPPHLPSFPRRLAYRRHVDPVLREVDGVVTVDPTIYHQGHLGIRRARNHGTPVWFDTSVTVPATGPDMLWEVSRPRIKRGVERATGIIATVPKCIERFREIGIFNHDIASKFTFMGHPVDTETFHPANGDPRDVTRILVVSRLVPEKGLVYILEALDPLLDAREDLELAILGSGPLDEFLDGEIEDRGLQDAVTFLKSIPHESMPEVLNTADMFVNHSVGTTQWEEFFGVANLEAMACGLPCVVSDCGAIPYVIREADRAVVVEERNVIELRRAVEQLLDDDERRAKLGQRAREYVEEYYSVPVIAERYHEMLQREL